LWAERRCATVAELSLRSVGMAQPYVGQILIFGGNFAPAGWMLCQGQLLPISENETLFQLIGTTYGGDGQSTFQLPDLRGRAPLHMGQGSGLSSYVIGQASGTESVTLTTQQITAHNHAAQISTSPANSSSPSNTILANEAIGLANANCFSYNAFGGTQSTLAPATLQNTGGNQPHENRQPLLVLNYIISLFGVFPSQN
jgi:microcystin-dependent protein